ncbi:hypothetical protein QT231_22700 [Halomonas sp. SpR1]|uniref:hypothetical protein n=1 Tax=Halomonas sp. SpR1 TaxID=3050462 RepID=UPI0027E5AEDD|nr:hypothetical protein [Halomonas sp. SpR1]MDQ7735519.1 hypothetical protein [Halomonas sp. SpR1]
MSLESQITALVSAANKLTSEVANKMKGIDRKVDEAVASVPKAIRDNATAHIFVDTETGSDTNNGTSGSPLKTIAAVNKLIVPGTSVNIYLANGQTFEESGRLLAGTNNSVLIRARALDGPNPVLKWQPDFDPDAGVNKNSGILLTQGNVTFVQVDMNISNRDNGAELTSQAGLVQSNLGKLDIFIRGSHVALNNAPLVTAYAGYDATDLHFNTSSVSVTANDNGHGMLVYNRGNTSLSIQMRLSVNATSLLGQLKWRDLLPIKADNSNILTNLDGTAL